MHDIAENQPNRIDDSKELETNRRRHADLKINLPESERTDLTARNIQEIVETVGLLEPEWFWH